MMASKASPLPLRLARNNSISLVIGPVMASLPHQFDFTVSP
jgi:hypothetical protein